MYQLREFYAPMLRIRERLRSKNVIRLKVSKVAHEEWTRLIEEAIDLHETRKQLSPEFEKIIDYENQHTRRPCFRDGSLSWRSARN